MLDTLVLASLVTPALVFAQASFKEISFDEFAQHMIVRSLPLHVALPSSFAPLAEGPTSGLWLPPEFVETVKKTGNLPPEMDYFRVTISTNVGYYRQRDEFICGPDCGEQKIDKQIQDAGVTIEVSERHRGHGFPIWLHVVRPAKNKGTPRPKLYTAYIGLFIATNAAYITYAPKASAAAEGDAVWNAFVATLLASNERLPTIPAPAHDDSPTAFLQMREDAQPYQAFLDTIERALLAGDQTPLTRALRPHRLAPQRSEAVPTRLARDIRSFFAQGQAIDREIWIFPASDEFGRQGFAFYKKLVIKDGTKHPYAVHVLRENGTLVIGNFIVNKSYEDLHSGQHPQDARQ
jgi:hypothetical protein